MLQRILTNLAPDEVGALWIGLLVTLLVFGEFGRLWSRQNASLAALLLVAPLLTKLLALKGQPWAFATLYLITAFYVFWGLALALGWRAGPWRLGVRESSLRPLLVGLLLLNAVMVFGNPPDDAGFFSNISALRWRETGKLPYGDPQFLDPATPTWHSAGTYGPLLVAAHVPFQWLLGAPENPAEMDPRSPSYRRPPLLASQLACFAFHLVGLFALFRIVEPLSGRLRALAVVVVYAGSPYIIGLGGGALKITGLTFISHIAPSAAVLAAFLFLERPFLAGVLLGAATGILYYPAFLFCAWAGWLIARRRSALNFTVGFALAGILIAGLVAACSHAPDVSGAARAFVASTVEHQEGTAAGSYGAGDFSFWGTHPSLAAFWNRPLFGSTSLFKPTFLIYVMFSLGAFFLARNRGKAQLAALTASLAAAAQLWRTHAPGTYVEWFYPFLLIALFAGESDRDSTGAPEVSGESPNL